MKPKKAYHILRVPKLFYNEMLEDIQRPHSFAMERVGFFSTNFTFAGDNVKIITVTGYFSVSDLDYIDDPSVGAKVGSKVIRETMQRIIATGNGCLHVHMHDHMGRPGPSYIDLKSLPDLAEAFHNADPNTMNGYTIFSKNSFFCHLHAGNKQDSIEVDQLNIVGYPMKFRFPALKEKYLAHKVYDRQSFLGKNSIKLISSVRIGIVGLGGGGSHIAQQLAHLGFVHFSIFDGDHIEVTNHNRLIGGWFTDIVNKLKKTSIAQRLIKKINPLSKVQIFNGQWQEYSAELKKCDIVIGCIDTFDQRSQLESACRRVLIPLIDIGMDIHKFENGVYAISGQVILSLPGSPCMRCFQFINEKKLSEEAKKYGETGRNPQVVWSNGVLASNAVGIVVDLVTGWSKICDRKVYLSYDGEYGHIADHPRINHCDQKCTHYPIQDTGRVSFKFC